MKKVLCMFALLMASLLSFADTYSILAKGKNSEESATGIIRTYPYQAVLSITVEINDLISKEFRVDKSKTIVDDYTVRYAILYIDGHSVKPGQYITIRLDKTDSSIYYFEVPNFYQGQSGTICYKVRKKK